MMKDKLQKAIELSRRTGDRLIVYDMAGNNDPFVVMAVDQYEKLTERGESVRHLSEQELTDKINRDIAIWRSEQNQVSEDFDLRARAWRRRDQQRTENSGFSTISDVFDETSAITDHLDEYRDRYLEEEDWKEKGRSSRDAGQSAERREAKRRWGIPEKRRAAADEVIEEDRQYLEEIPY